MWVFNCTKAAVALFTSTVKGEKRTCVEASPHKTIAESIEQEKDGVVFPNRLGLTEAYDTDWHWLVHCVSVKRKKYVLVMDYKTRYCMTMLAPKKGDVAGFLNDFEGHLYLNIMGITAPHNMNVKDIAASLEACHELGNGAVFYQRNDRSVQAHINDVSWHLQRHCYENFMLEEEEDLLDFNLFTGEIPRTAKGQKNHFYPVQAFLLQWLNAYSRDPEKIITPNLLEAKNYFQTFSLDNLLEDDTDNKAADAALAELLKSLPAGVTHLGEGSLNQKNAKPTNVKSKNVKHKDNVIDFSAYQKKR
ncbi:hypothetical protein EBI01_11735 [Marinomonas rhizomae]|uniref:DUF6933 domain-containing protein n=1 Tax=Marinomonas rhizomae TaxID=491948 RepID=A0A366J9T4_9GAMM|nr:hypothetical protein [Marinomonas rhizomae]RBP83180.1 hypothetical protein DFP80_107158 [Marinomonas rhizomae]RNF72521.1 hypothetical protein EBI01_11735 [Marinomonas rhizomae]